MGQAEISTILVIGNNAHFCYLMRRYIRKSMFQPLFSTVGEEALALAQRKSPPPLCSNSITWEPQADKSCTCSKKFLIRGTFLWYYVPGRRMPRTAFKRVPMPVCACRSCMKIS